jgi:hypothetical protein
MGGRLGPHACCSEEACAILPDARPDSPVNPHGACAPKLESDEGDRPMSIAITAMRATLAR